MNYRLPVIISFIATLTLHASWAQNIVSTPTSTQTITQPIDTTLKVNSLDSVINPTLYSGSDLGAQINTVLSNTTLCPPSNGCTIIIPPGSYSQTTAISISIPNVNIEGYGVIVIANGPSVMLTLAGNNDSVQGVQFNLAGSATYAVAVTRSANGVAIMNNIFLGQGSYGILASYAGSGLSILNNTFESDGNGHGPGPMSIQFTSGFSVIGNHLNNTSGFGIPMFGSDHGTVMGNEIYEPGFKQTVIATSGQMSFTVTLSSPAVRLFAQVNGVPTPLASASNTSGNTWTATFSTAPGSGATVTFVGYQSLEDIQVNSQSFDISITGNALNGTGDSGIDVVSDYHANILQTITSTNNQTVFYFTGAVTHYPSIEINGRILTGSEILNGGPVNPEGNNWTVTLATPQPLGTAVQFADFLITTPTSADYPGNVVISGNNVRGAAAAGIAVEVTSNSSTLTGNVIEDCGLGQGITNTAYSSGIFVVGPISAAIKDNTVINSLSIPTMQVGISMLGFGTDFGTPQKNVVVGGNTFTGAFASTLFIPTATPTSRQVGIDVQGLSVPYPEQVVLDDNWSGLPNQTNYYSYTSNNAAVTRDTTNVLGGAASLQVDTVGDSVNSQFQIFPTAFQQFANSILKVSFWAKALSGSMNFQVFSTAGGVIYPSSFPITSSTWQKYSLYLDTNGITLAPGDFFIRISSPGNTSANTVFSNFNIFSTPLNAGEGSSAPSNVAPASTPAPLTATSFNQYIVRDTAGTCQMSSGTSCSFSISHDYSAPACVATVQSGTTPIVGGCTVTSCISGGCTVTVTAASSNSATWAAFVWGNPN